MVETLFVVIVVLVVHHLPTLAVTKPLTAIQTTRNLVVAGIMGATVTLLIWSVTAQPFSTHVSEYFAAKSVPAAHGQNVVNVVLVDFRATDTLGEIAVLAVAALSVYALLKVRPRRSQADGVLQEDAP